MEPTWKFCARCKRYHNACTTLCHRCAVNTSMGKVCAGEGCSRLTQNLGGLCRVCLDKKEGITK